MLFDIFGEKIEDDDRENEMRPIVVIILRYFSILLNQSWLIRQGCNATRSCEIGIRMNQQLG